VPRHPDVAHALGLLRRVLLSPGVAPARHVLVACSGGADSIALLGLCSRLAHGLDLVVSVGHVDHRLRAESASEAALVGRVAADLGLSCTVVEVSLAPGPGLPDRARAARRDALRAVAGGAGARWIALGHTADDQAETMIMHLSRGCGLDGLAAMPGVERPWLRPLLGLARAQTRALAGHLGLPFVDDPSNADPGSLRVRVRERIVPVLREHNPRAERALSALATELRADEAALSAWTDRELHARARGPARLDLRGIDTVPRAVRTRLLRELCRLGGVDPSELTRRVVEQVDDAAVARAQRCRGAARAPSDAPLGWDLRPRRRLCLEGDALFVIPADGPNH
jgi:tRNA(Ile)-lysidine synthase